MVTEIPYREKKRIQELIPYRDPCIMKIHALTRYRNSTHKESRARSVRNSTLDLKKRNRKKKKSAGFNTRSRAPELRSALHMAGSVTSMDGYGAAGHGATGAWPPVAAPRRRRGLPITGVPARFPDHQHPLLQASASQVAVMLQLTRKASGCVQQP